MFFDFLANWFFLVLFGFCQVKYFKCFITKRKEHCLYVFGDVSPASQEAIYIILDFHLAPHGRTVLTRIVSHAPRCGMEEHFQLHVLTHGLLEPV